MKTFLQSPSLWQWAGLAMVLTALPSVITAEEPATAAAESGARAVDKTAEKLQEYKASPNEMTKAEVKAALDQIDAEVEHLAKLAEAAPTPEQKAEAELRHDVLKERRNELKRGFTRARYEVFKADLQAEMNKVSAWAKETFSGKPAARSAANTANDMGDSVSGKIADSRTDSTTLNKAEVKAALARLDADIRMLTVKIDALSDPDRKAELNRRLNAYKERRSELTNDFRQARYDALVADVKSEWNQLIR